MLLILVAIGPYIPTPAVCIIQVVVCLFAVQEVRQCCDGITCVRKFCSTDLNNCLQRYAQNVDNPHYKDMVEATFECFEALLNYRGKLSCLQ